MQQLKKRSTTIHEDVRRMLGVSRDIYAFCAYVHYRCADSRQKRSGWCCDNKQDVADFVGVTRPGLYKMAERLHEIGLIEISNYGDYRATPKWVDAETNCKQSLQNAPSNSVNKVDKNCKQSLQNKGKNVNKVYTDTLYRELDIKLERERNTPAPESQNLKEEKRDSGLVAPGEPLKLSKEQIEYLQSEARKEKAPSPNSAAAPSPLNLGFCGFCMGLGYRNGRNGRETCEDCEGSGHGQEMISDDEFKNVDAYYDKKFPIDPRQKQTLDFEDAKNAEHQKVERSGIDQPRNPLKDFLAESRPACDGRGNDANGLHCWERSGTGEANPNNTQFEVTAIASPTEFPNVTLVEAVKTRAENTLEAEQMITGWIEGEGEQTVRHRYNTAKQKFDPSNAAAIAAHYCSVYTKTAANKGRLLADPITHFSDGLFSYLKNEETFGRNNQPGNQGQTRNRTQGQKANINNLGTSSERYQETPLF